MLAWAQSMTWKSHPPTIRLNTSTYEQGIALTKQEMVSIEDRLERNPLLPLKRTCQEGVGEFASIVAVVSFSRWTGFGCASRPSAF